MRGFDSPGAYSIGFVINGPQGQGTGTLHDLTVHDQPGPPLALSWAVRSLPLVPLIAFLVVAWRRTGPRDQLIIG